MRARGYSSAVMLCAHGAQSLRRHRAGLVAFVGRAGLKTSMSDLSSDATDAETAAKPRSRAAPRQPVITRPWWARHYTFNGTTVGLVFLCCR